MRYLVLTAALLLSACGSGGGSNPPPPPPPPPVDTTPPTLSSSGTVSPANGSTGNDWRAVVTATASEALASAAVEVRCTETADGVETTVPGTTTVVGAAITWKPTTAHVAAAACTARLLSFVDNAGNAGTATALSNFGVKPLDCPAPVRAGYTYTGGTTRSICYDIYVDSNAPRTSYVDTVAVKRKNVQTVFDFFGSLATDADFMYCGTPGCTSYFSVNGSATWRSPGFFIVLPDGSLGPQFSRGMVVNLGIGGAVDNGTIAHELVHGELRARVSGGEVGGPRMPAWFDEGLATVIGDRQRVASCSAFNAVPDLRIVVTNSDFNTVNAANPGVIYCQAAREVDAWLRSKGTVAQQGAAVLALIDAVNAGTNFYTAYGALNF